MATYSDNEVCVPLIPSPLDPIATCAQVGHMAKQNSKSQWSMVCTKVHRGVGCNREVLLSDLCGEDTPQEQHHHHLHRHNPALGAKHHDNHYLVTD